MAKKVENERQYEEAVRFFVDNYFSKFPAKELRELRLYKASMKEYGQKHGRSLYTQERQKMLEKFSAKKVENEKQYKKAVRFFVCKDFSKFPRDALKSFKPYWKAMREYEQKHGVNLYEEKKHQIRMAEEEEERRRLIITCMIIDEDPNF